MAKKKDLPFVPKDVESTRDLPPVKLKIRRASIEDLASLMPLFKNGRFMELKQEALIEIKETPDDQFAIIKGSSRMIADRKERTAGQLALAGMLHKHGWIVRWSPQAEGFLLVRKEQWKAAKGGSK